MATRPILAQPIVRSRRAFVGSLGGAVLAAFPAAARLAFKTEIIVRTVANLRTPQDVADLVALAAQHGVGTINLAAKQDEDDEIPSGLVFYASRIAPRAPAFETFDALRETIREAHRLGLKVRAWMPQFHDQTAVRAHPEWQMRHLKGDVVVPYTGRHRQEFFVNPLNSDARDYQTALIEELARDYDVDGIVVDWVRFDDYAMDLGDETRARFKSTAGFDPIGIDFARDSPLRRQWNAWREAEIAAHIRRLRGRVEAIRPGLAFGVFVLPPAFTEVAQDVGQFSESVTFVSPMAYYKDWGLPSSWVVQELLPQTVSKAGRAEVIPVFDEDLSDEAGRAVLPQIRKLWPAIGTLSWFSYGRWTNAGLQRIDRLLQG
jgi:uncharacterized lipoprotein YddW (UPF0748 family)